jgi:hypothetical protein
MRIAVLGTGHMGRTLGAAHPLTTRTRPRIAHRWALRTPTFNIAITR